MNHREQEPDFDPDDSVERLIASAKDSAHWAEERLFARDADCPTPEELRDFERARIADDSRRRRLARHIVACPRCLDRNLSVFGAAESIDAPVSPALPAPVSSMPVTLSRRPRVAWLAAAAALLLTVGFLNGVAVPTDPARLGGVFATDADGFEMRSGAETPEAVLVERRVAVEVASSGWVALGRFTKSGIEPLAVSGASLAAPVTANEEVLLPLDRALPCEPGETWFVLWSRTEPSADALARRMMSAARGYHEKELEGRRVVPRPR